MYLTEQQQLALYTVLVESYDSALHDVDAEAFSMSRQERCGLAEAIRDGQKPSGVSVSAGSGTVSMSFSDRDVLAQRACIQSLKVEKAQLCEQLSRMEVERDELKKRMECIQKATREALSAAVTLNAEVDVLRQEVAAVWLTINSQKCKEAVEQFRSMPCSQRKGRASVDILKEYLEKLISQQFRVSGFHVYC